jgi:hypothetical protein
MGHSKAGVDIGSKDTASINMLKILGTVWDSTFFGCPPSRSALAWLDPQPFAVIESRIARPPFYSISTQLQDQDLCISHR